jgi:hypothetical protein
MCALAERRKVLLEKELLVGNVENCWALGLVGERLSISYRTAAAKAAASPFLT